MMDASLMPQGFSFTAIPTSDIPFCVGLTVLRL